MGQDADELVIDVDDTNSGDEYGRQGGDAGTKTSEAQQSHIWPGGHPVAPFSSTAAGFPLPTAAPSSTTPEYASVMERAAINSHAALPAVRSGGYPSHVSATNSLGPPTPYLAAPASSPAAAGTATPAARSAAQPPVRSSLNAAAPPLPLVAPSPVASASSPAVPAAAGNMAGAAGYTQTAVPTAPTAICSSLAPAAFSSPLATPLPAARTSASAVIASNVHDAARTEPARTSASSAVLGVPPPRGVPSNTAPVSSPVAAGGTGDLNLARVRVEKPNFSLWALPSLKTEALRQAGSNKTLLYGAAPEQQLRQISNAKRGDIAHALDARVKYRIELGLPPEWVATPVGITPEKKKQKREEKVEKARKKVGRQGGKAPVVTEVQTYTCRMVRLIMQPEFLNLYVQSKGGAGGIARAEQDEGVVGYKHKFYQKLAVAMVTVGWKDSNGNPLSVPDNHKQDGKAPESLTSRLATLPAEMERSAASLGTEMEDGFDGDRPTYLLDLQRHLFGWLKNVRKAHTDLKSKEAQSGGAGADPTEDGGFEEAIHPWQFMGGRLPTMLWEDGCRIFGGGDDFHFTGDAILADDDAGSGSSIPGGPGVRSAASKP